MLSLVYRGNSVHGNMAMDICVLKNKHEFNNIFSFKDELYLRAPYLSEMVTTDVSHQLIVLFVKETSYSEISVYKYLLAIFSTPFFITMFIFLSDPVHRFTEILL